jgi:hypothetical protein
MTLGERSDASQRHRLPKFVLGHAASIVEQRDM